MATPRRFGAGVYAGGSFPVGEFRDSAKTGYHVAGLASARVNNILDVRIDVVFNKFSDKLLSEGPAFREVGTNLLFGTVGAELRPDGTSATESVRNRISPFLLAGVGAYRFHFDHVCRGLGCTGPEREQQSVTTWGLNIGAGAMVPLKGMRTFFQAGYHAMLPNGKNWNTTLLLASFGLELPTNRR